MIPLFSLKRKLTISSIYLSFDAKDAVIKEEDRVIEKLELLLNGNHISQELFEKQKPIGSGSQPPRLYGLRAQRDSPQSSSRNRRTRHSPRTKRIRQCARCCQCLVRSA